SRACGRRESRSSAATVDDARAARIRPRQSTGPRLAHMATDGIDRADLDACLRVIAAAEALAPEHPDAVAVRRATALLFKSVKEQRRADRRAAVLAADAAVTAA